MSVSLTWAALGRAWGDCLPELGALLAPSLVPSVTPGAMSQASPDGRGWPLAPFASFPSHLEANQAKVQMSEGDSKWRISWGSGVWVTTILGNQCCARVNG